MINERVDNKDQAYPYAVTVDPSEATSNEPVDSKVKAYPCAVTVDPSEVSLEVSPSEAPPSLHLRTSFHPSDVPAVACSEDGDDCLDLPAVVILHVKTDTPPESDTVLTWSDGSGFTGAIRDGKIHGEGNYTWANGEAYTGQFRSDLFHGHGVSSWPDGRVYSGQYKAGKQHGMGEITWPDGRRYAGTWRSAQKRGPWEFTPAAGGEVKQGDWGEGESPDPTIGLPPIRSTEGTCTWADGGAYEGQLLNGACHGHGCAVWPGGARFTGQYRSGVRSGAGVQQWPDGRRFAGQWRGGQKRGSWEYTDAGGEVRRGAWETAACEEVQTPRHHL